MAGWGLVLALIAVLGSCCLIRACPDGCFCRHEQGLYVANCSSLPSVGGKIEALTLLPSPNPIELVDGQFNSARHLKYLSLKNCSIYYIHKKAFYGTKNVIEIDLSYNQLEELEPTTFQHLTSMATLILRGNPIQFMSELPFLISNSLQHLDVGQCNIKHIPRGVFYGLKRLKYLSLDKNLLKSIKYNSLPKGLKYLDISHNLIVNVPTEVISSLINLRRLGLNGNPINCSCSLMNLQDWLSGRGVIFEEDVICVLPSKYNGVSWSKVDENALCLAEARREELFHSIYNPLFKNRLYRDNYFENENSYQAENLQADQPQTFQDPQAEILFQNDETLAMGEMMRNEGDSTDLIENEKSGLVTDSDVAASEKLSTNTSSEINPDIIGKINVDTAAEGDTLIVSDKENVLQEFNNSNSKDNFEITNNSSSSSLSSAAAAEENPSSQKPEEHATNVLVTGELNLNDSKPVEFKTENEDDTDIEQDDFKKEGLFHVDKNIFVDTNSTLEESTVFPDIEETTEDELPSTEETLIPDYNSNLENEPATNITSTTENYNSTLLEEPDFTDVNDVIAETVLPPSEVSDLYNQNNNTETNISGIVISENESGPSTDDNTANNNNNNTKLMSAIATDGTEEKIKEVAGAEVVMFCVGVLILCLLLYSVYKCRNSNKRQNIRIVKEKQSSRDTEMQDMASLLPKPADDNKKNTTKYPDKAPSSETEKLISNQNEKELPTITPISETKDKIEDKNSLNNNTPAISKSPSSKTPLIQQEKPIIINTAAPIQRTKVKVGIIPDSIPRTPIFLQKSYNGTKNV